MKKLYAVLSKSNDIKSAMKGKPIKRVVRKKGLKAFSKLFK